MQIDIGRHLGAVTREVANRMHEGRLARVVVASRVYDTTPEDLWEAITSAERIPRWFLPVTGELRLGGTYQLQGNAGGRITGCEPPRHLALTWEMHGDVSWVDVRLEARPDGQTGLVLEHVAHVDDERWGTYGPGAVGVGWELALLGLALHLASKTAVDPKAVEAWTTSPEGRGFVRGSSEGWGQASIAAGTGEAAAREAAARTTAFYSG